MQLHSKTKRNPNYYLKSLISFSLCFAMLLSIFSGFRTQAQASVIETGFLYNRFFSDVMCTNTIRNHTIYTNGTKKTIGTGSSKTTYNYGELTVYSDVYAPYYRDDRGYVKQGKVIVGLTNSTSMPTISNNKIMGVDASVKQIASAQYKKATNGVTIRAKKKTGTVYLWLITVTKKDVKQAWTYMPIQVLGAPNKIELLDKPYYHQDAQKYTKATVTVGDSATFYVKATTGGDIANNGSYTVSVPTTMQRYVTVSNSSSYYSGYTVKANSLKNNKKTNVTITVTCNQNSKKAKFVLTIVNHVKGVTIASGDGSIKALYNRENVVNRRDSENPLYYYSYPVALYPAVETAQTATLKITPILSQSNAPSADKPTVKTMNSIDGFKINSKGRVILTDKATGNSAKIKVTIKNNILTIKAAKNTPNETKTYALVIYNTYSNRGYFVVPIVTTDRRINTDKERFDGSSTATTTGASGNASTGNIDLATVENARINGNIQSLTYGSTGSITSIDGSFTNERITSVAAATNILNSAGSLFAPRTNEFSASSNDVAEQVISDGNRSENFYRYSPSVGGIPVIGSQIVIATDANGNVTGLSSSYDEKINNVDRTPTVDGETARQTALSKAQEADSTLTLDDNVGNADICIYASGMDTMPILVYSINVSRYEESNVVGSSPINNTYYIYANGQNAGKIFKTVASNDYFEDKSITATDLSNASRMINIQTDNTEYILRDGTRNIETYYASPYIWTVENGNTRTEVRAYPYPLDDEVSIKQYLLSCFGTPTSYEAGDCAVVTVGDTSDFPKEAITLHANAEKVYDYYKGLGLTSYDGKGSTLKIRYRQTQNAASSSWNENREMINFMSPAGDSSYYKAVDIMGHEYTHAVIQNINGLISIGEAGALSEAYSDIFGALAEGASGDNKWKMGENSGTVIRDISNPSISHYQNYNQNGDNHDNAGIFSKAAHLMMSNQNSGVSEDEWAKVFYHSLYRLPSDASFLDARRAVVIAAKRLGFDNSKQEIIKNAFNTVGICEEESIRIILTWGQSPSDLDSHLVGTGVNGATFHTCYWQRDYYTDGTIDSRLDEKKQLYADLDYDDVTSYGPEVTTLYQLKDGTYDFYVHDYSTFQNDQSTILARSGAKVDVYRGNTKVQTYTIDANSQGTVWDVFRLTIRDGNISYTKTDTYGDSQDSNHVILGFR